MDPLQIGNAVPKQSAAILVVSCAPANYARYSSWERRNMTAIHHIKSVPVLRGLSADEARVLGELASTVELMAGTEVITPPGIVLIMLGGEVNCFIRDAADQKFLLSTLSRGDVVGELSFLVPSGGNDQKVELQVKAPASCLQIDSSAFFEIVCRNPLASEELLKMLAARLSAMNRFAIQAVNIEIDPSAIEATTWSEKLADAISARVGSWYFLLGGLLFTAVWMGLNAFAWAQNFDPYPFIFLNLVFSLMSAATMPVLLMSQNRQSQLDRIAAKVNHMVTLRANQLLGGILKELSEVRGRLDRIEG